MNKETEPLVNSIREIFEPIVKVSSAWPPVLAYGIPLIVSVLLIALLRSTLPNNIAWLVTIVVLAPIVSFIFLDWDRRHLDARSKILIIGNVLFSDGSPVKGAKIFVEGIDRSKETDETGWFQIEVNRQEEWVVRATFEAQVAKTVCKQIEIAQPIRITLRKSNKQPLTVSYSVKELDGGKAVELENLDYYTEGCKFRLQLSNTTTSTIIVDALHLLIKEYSPLAKHIEFHRDLSRMQFGQARVPHQLFLYLNAKQWRGSWVIASESGSETKIIDGKTSNLLEVRPPLVFQLAPGEVELIHGAITTELEGLYTFGFSIEYTPLGLGRRSLKTQPVRLVRTGS